MTITLRPYQKECVETIIEKHKQGITRQLVVLPTGAGKTIVMAQLAKELGIRTLILAHRGELLTQAIDKFQLVHDCDIGLVKADSNEHDKYIVVASVQSASQPKRLEQLQEQDFNLLMIDEAHHSTSPSYLKIINQLGFNSKNRKKLMVGVTATPMRESGDGLGTLFEEITYQKEIAEMIADGYLSPIHGQKILTKCSLESLKLQNGDYPIGDLAEVVNTPERNSLVAEKYLEYASDRKGVIFGVDVEHCKDLADIMSEHGVPTKAIYGEMEDTDREEAVKGLSTGKYQALTSCGVLTEGFDEPSLSVVAMARPTQSKGLYIQCVGRGLRPYPGKENCLVLDFTDEGHRLKVPMTLSKAIDSRTQNEKERDEEAEREKIIRKIYIGKNRESSFDLLGLEAQLLWVDIGDGEWSLLADNNQEIILHPKDNAYIAVHYSKEGSKLKDITKKPIALGYAYTLAESYARKNMRIEYSKVNSSWHLEDASEKQLELWNSLKIKGAPSTKFECSVGIRKTFGLKSKSRRKQIQKPPSDKQIAFLKSFNGWREGMSALDAQRVIGMRCSR
jgi:ATP-dependent helicase IRC3